jgi:nucleoside-diphosphate-sugar epimerase
MSPGGFAALSGERACRAAYAEQGFRFTICRPFDVYGAPATAGREDDVETESELDGMLGELARGALAGRERLELSVSPTQTRTPTHLDDVAEGLRLALGSPKAVGEDFNLGGAQELALAEIARIAWAACDGQPDRLSLKAARGRQPGPKRSAPSSQKARRLLGWQARVEAQDGIAASAREALGASVSATPA